jgi:hypothetical protein
MGRKGGGSLSITVLGVVFRERHDPRALKTPFVDFEMEEIQFSSWIVSNQQFANWLLE